MTDAERTLQKIERLLSRLVAKLAPETKDEKRIRVKREREMTRFLKSGKSAVTTVVKSHGQVVDTDDGLLRSSLSHAQQKAMRDATRRGRGRVKEPDVQPFRDDKPGVPVDPEILRNFGLTP